NSTCGSANGSANVVAAGGTAGYSYLWTPGNYTTSYINNLSAGNYFVTVTDANGCTANILAAVGNTGGPNVAAALNSDVTCFGGSDGSASVNIVSGTAPFNILWTPSGLTTANASNLAAGSYSVSVTDANGCISNSAVVISEP